ncbi:hypothetical protein FRC10_003208 [Ceratobasidium sp. 414]|nr:hypothetical protein FRC10_003208 [Ceratobasidium sp. 414]
MHETVDLPGHGIVHSALNISNVLIKDSGRAVISGFGHAKIIQNFQESFTGDNQDYRYMASDPKRWAGTFTLTISGLGA